MIQKGRCRNCNKPISMLSDNPIIFCNEECLHDYLERNTKK